MDYLFSDSLVVIQGMECEEGDGRKHTPPAFSGCHALPADEESGCNAPVL